jgi:hypothetical protein
MQAHPNLDVANVINRIVATADRIGAEGNIDYGYGVIDAREAVLADIPEVSRNPLGTMTDWIEMNRADDWTSTDVAVDVPLNPSPSVVASENSQFDADMAESARTIGLPILVVGGLLVSFAVAIYGTLRTKKRQTPRDPTV